MTTTSARTESIGAARPSSMHRLVAVVAIVVLAIDVLLLTANAALNTYAVPFFRNAMWDGDLDGSLIELFGYLQLAAASLALLGLWVRRRIGVYGAWALIFAVLVVDDWLMIHEYGGAQLIGLFHIQPAAGLHPQDIAEILVWVILASVLGVLLLIAYERAPRVGRRDSNILFGLVALLSVFTVGLDLVDSVVDLTTSDLMRDSFTLTETSGELLVMSFMLVTVLRMLTDRSADAAAHRQRSEA